MEALEAGKNEGWWWPVNSRKAHYMVAGRSLCGQWLVLGRPELEQNNDNSPDNCRACVKRLTTRRLKEMKQEC